MSHLMRFPHLRRLRWAALLPTVEDRRPIVLALLACLALLVVWQNATIREALLQPLGGFALGMILGAMTGVAFVVRQRGRR